MTILRNLMSLNLASIEAVTEKIAIAIGGIDRDRCNPCTDKLILKCKDCLETAKNVINELSIEDLEIIINEKRFADKAKRMQELDSQD